VDGVGEYVIVPTGQKNIDRIKGIFDRLTQRKETARQAYEDLDDLDNLVKGMFAEYDTLLQEVESSLASIQGSLVKLKQALASRRALMERFFDSK